MKTGSQLNKDVIKYFAMLTMLLNHIAQIFLQPETLLYTVFEDIGYFTAITMCYFLVEGFYYTKSRKKYAGRLLVFAIISQVPFMLAFQTYNLNMIFTLFICMLILLVLASEENTASKTTAVVILVMITAFCDWPVLAAIYTILFYRSRKQGSGIEKPYFIGIALFYLFNLTNYMMVYNGLWAMLYCLFSTTAMFASYFVIKYFYNGKQAVKGRQFSKWFFYIFYPAHLILLTGVKYFLHR